MNAVSWGADMICVCSVDPVTIQQGLQEAADAGIMVTTCSTGIFSPNPVEELEEGQLNYAYGCSPDYAASGRAIADWIVNDAGNQGEIVIVDADEAAARCVWACWKSWRCPTWMWMTASGSPALRWAIP